MMIFRKLVPQHATGPTTERSTERLGLGDCSGMVNQREWLVFVVFVRAPSKSPNLPPNSWILARIAND